MNLSGRDLHTIGKGDPPENYVAGYFPGVLTVLSGASEKE